MAETNDTLWLPVLPSMKGFGPALAKGAGAEADKSGKAVGSRFGKAVMLGTAAIGAGAIAAGTALYKVGEIFDDVADTIRVGTGATGKDLDGLIDVAKRVGGKVPAEFEAIGSTVADVNTRMGLSGETLELVASQYLEAGRILGEEVDIMKTGAAFNAFKIEGDDVSGALDHLFQVSQATGMGMNELADAAAKNAPAMQTLGFSFEETTAMVGSFDKAGLNSSALMASMSKGLVTLAKDGEKPKDAFERVQKEIAGFIEKGDEAGALNLASKVFGTRGATQFVGALKDGALNLGDMSKAAGQTSDTIMGAGAETMDFAEHWQIFKNKILVALEPIASRVFGGMGTLMENLGAVLESHVIPAFEGLLGFIDRNKVILGIFGGVVASVMAGFWIATAAMKAWTFATTGWSAVTKIATGVQKAFNLAMKANPIMFVVTLITALVAAIVWLYRNNETARRIIDGAWIGIKNAISFAWNRVIKPVFTAITNFVKNTLGAVFTWFRDKVITPVWNGIKSGISGAWTGIKATFNAINTFIRGTLAGGFTWFKNSVITPVWNGIKSAISGSWSGIKGTFNAIKNFLRDTLGPVFTWLRDKVIKPVWDSIKNSISNVWNNGIKPIFEVMQKALKGDFTGAFRTAKDAIGRIWAGLKDVAKKPIAFVINTVLNKGLIGAFNKVAGWIPGVNKLDEVKIPGFARGGWTGPGAKYDEAGIVHADEFVVRKESQRDLRKKAPGFLDSLNRFGAKALGYANGGLVHPMDPAHRGVSAGWHGYKGHVGTDYPAPVGTPVHSPGPGTVAQTGWNLPGGTGKQVWINHDNGLLSRVHHLSQWLVKVGQRVTAGQAVGRVGMTGNTTGPHAHWGVMNGSQYLNPASVWGSGKGGGGAFFGGGGGFDPLSAFTGLTDKVTGWFKSKFPEGGHMVDIAKGVGGKLIGDVKGWAKGKLDSIGDFASGAMDDLGKSVGGLKYRGLGAAALKHTGDYSLGNLNSLMRRMRQESGFNPRAINNWDSNAKRGTPSKGLMQVIGPTFASYRDRSLGNDIWDPLQNVVASIRYAKSRYGNVRAGWDRKGGYADGGLVNPLLHDNGGVLDPGLSMILNKTRKPEAIYNDAQNRALQTLAARGASQDFPSSVVLRVGEQKFTAYLEQVNDNRIAQHVSGMRQVQRQSAGIGR